tara:strand:+ start:311 stop:583 length:273 start_codon:yes stop_codon:yes gene_type:complete
MSDNETVKVETSVRRKRRLRVAYNNSQTEPGRKVAAIRISGVYLEDLGFKAGDYFDMTINDDKSLTLKPVTAEQIAQEKAAREVVMKTTP